MGMVTKKQIILRKLEEEKNFLSLAIKSSSFYYHDIIRNYSSEDRGLSSILQLIGYLYTIPEDSNDFNESGLISQLENKTLESSIYIPAMMKELPIIKKMKEKTNGIVKIAYDAFSRDPPVLMPEEYSEIVYHLGNWIIYMNYRYCYCEFRRRALTKGDIREILEKYKGVLDAFMNNTHFYMGEKVFPFAFVTFFIIDAHDNSVISEYLKNKNIDFLFEYVPEKGLEEILFKKEEEVKKAFNDFLRYRVYRDKMCIPSSLKQRMERKKVERYRSEVYSSSSFYLL